MSRHALSGSSRRQILAALAALALGGGHVTAQAQAPKPMTMVVPFPAGGTTDILGRIMARQLGLRLGETIVVDNKPGAGGGIGTGLVAKAPADGRTLLLGTIGTHSINPALYKKLPYDPVKDFIPVTLVAMVPNVLVVPANSPLRSVKDVIAQAKAQPGKLSYASAGNGTSIHLSGAMFEQVAQVDMQHVPYRGSAPAVTDLIGGQTAMMFDNLPSAMPHIKSGALRALAVTSAVRAASLPDLPTIAQAGLPGYEASSWFGLWLPAGTPAAVAAKIGSEARAILADPEVRRQMLEQGAEAAPMTSEQFAAFIAAESAKWGKVVRDAKVTLD
ncbi:MAG TPA: tripartite tricarboxylate transporter substrate binding protein [Burkholderiaceae bacterium]|nr:tripartite tricarboxylate transporter substrate binding protein [Burkholderiaceae bacterium]HMZ01198.1 tripartite tricarboxylate transporter substrate binding protein [Burkholderiaceae bacterium]HNB44663.1 tripartite tricarboxylate transporter substrate binding protein [Burkholderiaceae bacterium]HNG81658.1 tripartite tricarboxylate transporter substrate binding protein [Burkholderiaceae bacterium]